jgi:DNA-binding MarR family transcriptional regulator
LTELPQSLSDQAAHKFLLINRYLRQYARQMDSQGIRPREFSILRFLLEKGPATVGQVQEYLYRSASVASTVIAKLEEAGHVTRTRSTEDNRVVVVELTPAGQAIAEQAPMGGIPLLRRRLPTLSEARLARLNAALDDLMDLMEITTVD